MNMKILENPQNKQKYLDVPFIRAVKYVLINASHNGYQTHNLDNPLVACAKTKITAL